MNLRRLIFATCVFLMAICSPLSFAKESIQEKPILSELEVQLIDQQTTLTDKFVGKVPLAAGRSCSAKDGSKDCYCTGGCWRSETDCGCTGGGFQAPEIFDPLDP